LFCSRHRDLLLLVYPDAGESTSGEERLFMTYFSRTIGPYREGDYVE
jgi:hypothetical protein